MPDLVVNTATLAEAAKRLREAEKLTDTVRDQHHVWKDDAGQAGRDDVADAARHFIDRWGYGIGCLGREMGALGELLDRCVKDFEATESQLTHAQRPDGNGR